jgi:glycosyltransferase involved in cell wall biosynthesis
MEVSPTVSIVLPTYNRAYCIGRCIASVIDQTFSDWELLVVDNNSCDDTIDVVGRFDDNRIKLLTATNDGVIAKSRNIGIEAALGEYIAFIDSDDWWLPEKLARCISELVAGHDLVYHDLGKVHDRPTYLPFLSNKTNSRQLGTERDCFSDLLIMGNAIPNSSVIVRAALLRRIKGICEDRSLIGAEDYDTWLRVARHTNRFRLIPGILGYYSVSSDSTTMVKTVERYSAYIKLRYTEDLLVLGIDCPAWVDFNLARCKLKQGEVFSITAYLPGSITYLKQKLLRYLWARD